MSPFMGWCRQHLFSSPLNTLITLVLAGLLILMIPPMVSWLLIDATWTGESAQDCQQGGACWAMIQARFGQFMYGFYPESERYRIHGCGLIVLVALLQWWFAYPIKVKAALSLVAVAAILILLTGGWFGLQQVPTDLWGGLFLTLILAFGSIIASFPIALLLALGRASNMPVTKTLCVTYIEFVRGVPLITVLFMASVMLPMFLPQEMDLNKLLRAFLGITLFQAAYLAEVIRGGLRAIPDGQKEATQSLGLSYWPMMALIILPQALKIMIPGIVNTFIALFKDTTLVLIIGLFDFLGIVQAATTDPKWLGTAVEGYVFCAFVYFIFCFGMSQYSQHLERKWQTGHQDELR